MKHRDKISVKDIERVTINLQIYCQYTSDDKLGGWVAVVNQEGAPWQMHTNNQDLEALMRNVAGEVIIRQRIIKPWYNIILTEGPFPRKEGMVQYTAKPPEDIKRKVIKYLKYEKEELADKMFKAAT